MAKQSLFSACKRVFRDGVSGTYTVGNNEIFLELYGQEDINKNNEIGNSSEGNIVVVAGDTITIPSGYTLTPVKPKKSLVIICNTFINNGTVSMYQKAPNVLPHDFFIILKQEFGGSKDVIISAYADNGIADYTVSTTNGQDGNNGTNRDCGSGGTGTYKSDQKISRLSGSGYAFGGGAGGAGNGNGTIDTIYPMRGGVPGTNGWGNNEGGVGNPVSDPTGRASTIDGFTQNFGCGGRIVIFCNNFTNNGTISVNGTNTKKPTKTQAVDHDGYGGASGAGAVDLFYTTLVKQGTITATGGDTFTMNGRKPGKGGNGSITLTAWDKSKIIKPIAKYMSRANMVYFLTEYITRLKQGED